MIDPKSYDICFYHKCCPDGVGAALPFYLNGAQCIPVPPAFRATDEEHYANKRIVFVDVTPKRELFETILDKASHVCVIDHHKTAIDMITDMSEFIAQKEAIIHYDVARSAAQISWALCFPDTPEPFYISVIADRDLWKWEYPKSREIGNAMYSDGYYTLHGLSGLYYDMKDMSLHEINNFISELVYDGTIIENEKQREIESAVNRSVLCKFEGRTVRLSCSSVHRSDIGDAILQQYNDCDFAVIVHYDYSRNEYWISFRADDREGGSDSMLDLVQKNGGGGHPKACGMTVNAEYISLWDIFEPMPQK